jgi:hypothetical protein
MSVDPTVSEDMGWRVPVSVVAAFAFALAGFLTGLLDYLSWGGWYTAIFFGLPPLVGLLLSAKSFFQQKEASKK